MKKSFIIIAIVSTLALFGCEEFSTLLGIKGTGQITVSETALEIPVGVSRQVSITSSVTTPGLIEWVNNNPEVMGVTGAGLSGHIRGQAPGSGSISLQYPESEPVTIAVLVYSTDGDDQDLPLNSQYIQKLDMDDDTYTIRSTISMKVRLVGISNRPTEESKIQWESSNPDIVHITKPTGPIMEAETLGIGTAIITANYGDLDSVSATVTVIDSVWTASIAPTALNFEWPSDIAFKTLQLTLAKESGRVLNSDYANVEWRTDDPDTLTVTSFNDNKTARITPLFPEQTQVWAEITIPDTDTIVTSPRALVSVVAEDSIDIVDTSPIEIFTGENSEIEVAWWSQSGAQPTFTTSTNSYLTLVETDTDSRYPRITRIDLRASTGDATGSTVLTARLNSAGVIYTDTFTVNTRPNRSFSIADRSIIRTTPDVEIRRMFTVIPPAETNRATFSILNTNVATITRAGNEFIITGVADGNTDLRIIDAASGSDITIPVQVDSALLNEDELMITGIDPINFSETNDNGSYDLADRRVIGVSYRSGNNGFYPFTTPPYWGIGEIPISQRWPNVPDDNRHVAWYGDWQPVPTSRRREIYAEETRIINTTNSSFNNFQFILPDGNYFRGATNKIEIDLNTDARRIEVKCHNDADGGADASRYTIIGEAITQQIFGTVFSRTRESIFRGPGVFPREIDLSGFMGIQVIDDSPQESTSIPFFFTYGLNFSRIYTGAISITCDAY